MANKGSGYSISGYEELLANIDKLGKEADVASRKAVKAAGIEVRDVLEKNTPKQRVIKRLHAKDHVVVSNNKRDKDTGASYVSVGYPKGIAWRVHFVEFGTIRQKPQLFITKTINETKDTVRETIASTLRKELGL